MEQAVYKIEYLLKEDDLRYDLPHNVYCENETMLQIMVNGIISNGGVIKRITTAPISESRMEEGVSNE